ncbi:MAG TPA: sulfurtransferase [Curvibacter sp.]|nr:sulfurtransferase [Curvibacter sp.]|tara:strand:- start:66 stop:425 length:360 start_codon:yes stop_codon:yes gene_type:complete
MDHHDEEFLRQAALAKARVTQIEPAQVDAQAAAGALVIDVRELAERAQGTVPGSHHVALDTLAQNIQAVVPDKAAPIICFCNGGNRGALAAAQLLDLGYTNVQSIAGGLRAYDVHKKNK